jgi:hypothetical protein
VRAKSSQNRLSCMTDWKIERIITFEPGDLCKDGFVHFGFHDREGRHYALEHQKHFLGLVGERNKLEWTVANCAVFEGVPNIKADIEYPMYIDSMPDGTLIQSNFGNNLLFRINARKMEARLFSDGTALDMKRAGNCVVDDEGCVWVNEVEGCRVWRFDSAGKPILTLGNGKPGFQFEVSDFERVRFNWIYDIRKGPDGNIYVLDSKNFALRMIDRRKRHVVTLAGAGKAGYEGDGENARSATFGGDPNAKFDGPISMSIDEEGNIFVGDRFNHVVRMIERKTGIIQTIAGNHENVSERRNDPEQRDPLKLNLPKISSMDYYDGRLFIPTDLTDDLGDLIVLRKT